MSRANSKRVPTSLKAAFEQDKAQGIQRGLSVERQAELHAVSASRMYKWMEDTDLPANRLAAWFHHTHGRAVIRYLAAQAGGLYVQVPTGRTPSPIEMTELQQVLADTTGALLRFYGGQADADTTLGAVQQAMEALAYHRGNVEKHAQPELEFGS